MSNQASSIAYVLIVHDDGTALELRGTDACGPWEKLLVEMSIDRILEDRPPADVPWHDGRASWRVLEAARAYRATPVDGEELERARMDLVAVARLLPEEP